MVRVAIVGVAQTHHAEKLSETTHELMYQVCRQVLEEVGLVHFIGGVDLSDLDEVAERLPADVAVQAV